MALQSYLVRLEMGGGRGPLWLFLVFTYGISGGPPNGSITGCVCVAAAGNVGCCSWWSEFRGARSIAELRRRIIRLLFISCRLVPGDELAECEQLLVVPDIIGISHVLDKWWTPRADVRRSSTTSLPSLQSVRMNSVLFAVASGVTSVDSDWRTQLRGGSGGGLRSRGGSLKMLWG